MIPMADANGKILPGTVTAKPETSMEPAVAAPPVTVGNPDKIIERLKAKVRGAMPIPAKKPEATKPGDVPKTEETDNPSVPPKFLAELGKLQGKIREYEPKIKELDGYKADAELARSVKELWSGDHTKKLEAIAKITGKDPLDELAGLIKAYYDLEQSGETGDPKDLSSDSPHVKELKDQLSAAMKRIDAWEAKEAERTKESEKSATQAEIEKANGFVSSFVDKHKDKFEICARKENQAEAIDLIQSAAMVLIETKQKKGELPADMKQMTQAQAEAVYLEAAKKTETAFEKIGKNYAKGRTTEDDDERYTRHVRRSTPPTVVVTDDDDKPLSSNPDERFAQIRARAHAKAEAGFYKR